MAYAFGFFGSHFLEVFLLVAVLLFLSFSFANSDDGTTLLEIKKSFRDVDNVLYDWTDSPSSDYCVWRGVSCDNLTFNVIALNFSGLNLDGEISPAIGQLKSLASIDLRGNRLSGQIPDEIGDCSALQSLDFSFNELDGDIPFSVSKLKQLEALMLKNNRLIGPIPSTLSQIPNLKILDLAQNKLSGEIPRLIYWNEVLQYLGLRDNNLVGTLSPDMCQLTGLWYFDVRNNSLTGSIPQNIGNCSAFQVLDLSYNDLTGEIPFNIGFLQIATLSLQGNRLSGPIPSVIGLMQALAVFYDEKTMTEKILQRLNLGNFQLGKTKVFLRAGQIGVLDSRRADILDSSAKRIQGRVRTFFARRDFLSYQAAAISLQACCRGYLGRNLYTSMREEKAAILVQKYTRRWMLRHAYMKLYRSILFIQSSIRGFSARQRFLHQKEHRAATQIQAYWRMRKICFAYHNRLSNIISIQCLWRQKMAKRELRRFKQEANESGALRLAKSKLEKQLEDLTWRLHLEKKLRMSSEESKLLEISKLQKTIESLTLELDAAKLARVNEFNKNAVLQRQLELSMKEKAALEKEFVSFHEQRNENAVLKSSLITMEEKNSALERELVKAKEDGNRTMEKLMEVERTCSQLQQNLQRLDEKLSNLADENRVLLTKSLSVTPKSIRAGFAKPFLDRFSGALAAVHSTDRKSTFESPTPSKMIAPLSQGLSDSRHVKSALEKHQENYEILSRCIKENLGFNDGKPVAACIIYRCLFHWHSFESERTAIFDFIIEGINDGLKVGEEDMTLPYWLSNASTLLCLLQKNLCSNGFLTANAQRSAGSAGLNGRVNHGLKSSFKYLGLEDGISHMEAKYPAILFKQQLTACVEKIFGLIRDNLKKEIAPLLGLCIQAPKTQRVHGGKSSRSPGEVPQQSFSSQWDSIIKFLDSLLGRLRGNHVPSFFIRKLITQVFSFINISLFNSLLLRRECCTFSNGEYVKSGLAELEKWIANAKEEFAGTSWHELNYIRQAVGFLVIHQKRKKTLEEIRQDLCPVLTIRQIYRISTMYWDDKYGTQSVSNEVVAQMRETLSKDTQNLTSNSFLLDDDLSIPFSTDDIYMALPDVEPSDVELPKFLSEYPSAQFLVKDLK